jgi:ribonuclease-3
LHDPLRDPISYGVRFTIINPMVMTMLDEHLREFENILEVRFANIDILKRALTHRSFVNESDEELRDNERLEFLGDAILDFIVADMLFRQFPDVSEGELTQLRAALVRTDSLAQLATDCKLGEFLLIGKGEESSGGRTRVNNLCRGFEAVVGAVYVDQGLEVVRDFMLPKLQQLLAHVLENQLHRDARSMLQERTQAELRFTPVYRVIDAAGPDHEKQFYIEVVVGDVVIGQGVGNSKRAAAQSAARAALKRLEEVGWPEEAHENTNRSTE